MTDIEIMLADYTDKIAELEKEKCDLLGLIQAKDKLINKMKCCDNCRKYQFEIEQKYCKSKNPCKNKSEWELAE